MSLGSFWNDLHSEDIHFRDNLQFELESDFAPLSQASVNISTQEFYFFIPSALQINQYTYSKEQFYKDRTNLIRYKTPEFSFHELVDPSNQLSPLNRLMQLKNASLTTHNVKMIQDELKLLGNIVRSALRVSVKGLLHHRLQLSKSHGIERLRIAIEAFCNEVAQFREAFWQVQTDCICHWSGTAMQSFLYIDEYISNSIDYYFTGFIEYARHTKMEHIHVVDTLMCDIVVKEKLHRQKYFHEPTNIVTSDVAQQEKMLYHKSLLNKYVTEALLLGLERSSWAERYGNIIAGVAAGIAMLIYVLLLFWNVPNLGFNSLPFLLFTVVLYILKDRVKDSLKALFHQHAVRWFSDYTTKIESPNRENELGTLREFFSFVSETGLPDDVQHIRQTEFDSDLRLFKQPESIFYYKKEMHLGANNKVLRARRHKLHTIFLFNIHLLLEKASNPFETALSLDANTMEVKELKLPKVYHINIIMKNTYLQPDLQKKIELKKFRLIIDKDGIKRVESVGKK